LPCCCSSCCFHHSSSFYHNNNNNNNNYNYYYYYYYYYLYYHLPIGIEIQQIVEIISKRFGGPHGMRRVDKPAKEVHADVGEEVHEGEDYHRLDRRRRREHGGGWGI